MLEKLRTILEQGTGRNVYLPGEVGDDARVPYLLLYTLAPTPIRAMARGEGARRVRFGVTCVDLGAAHIEDDADVVEAVLEGSRILHPASRIELAAGGRGPLARDPDVTVRGAEYTTLPLHWTVTIPKEVA